MSSSGTESDVESTITQDPTALTAQALLDDSLEITAQRLQTLRASQALLATQLNTLLDRLEKYDQQTKLRDISDTIAKIDVTKKRLTGINATLIKVEKRLERIRDKTRA